MPHTKETSAYLRFRRVGAAEAVEVDVGAAAEAVAAVAVGDVGGAAAVVVADGAAAAVEPQAGRKRPLLRKK